MPGCTPCLSPHVSVLKIIPLECHNYMHKLRRYAISDLHEDAIERLNKHVQQAVVNELHYCQENIISHRGPKQTGCIKDLKWWS